MMASETTGTEFSLVEQGTGIGQSTLPTVGYLGKVYESCKLNSECCPACKLKGQTRTLQAFRISFKESIVLCENPQCIYPLGHKPLQAITTSGSKSRNDQTKHSPRKRKIFESTNLISSDFASFGECTKQLKPCPEPSLITNVGHEENRNLSEQKFISINSSNDHIILGTSTSDGPLEPSLVPEVIVVPSTAPQIPIQCAVSDTKHFPQNLVCSNTRAVIAPADLVPKLHRTSFLQWRNKDALCWLDCILSSFVHLQTLEKAVAEPCTDEDSIFKRLFMTYNKASNLISQFTEGDHVSPSSLNVLSNAENLLNEIRSTIFELLQPQLKCQLGKNDMPVFALPLFIEKDPSFQKLFMQSFYWKFECLLCGYKSKDRCCKTLTTFTKVIAEWHPLHAVHVAPCNNCRDQCQRREMVLEKVPPVFMLHFSEGLPHSDLKAYSFQFEGDFYEITMIIQYQNKHFATWVLTPEGSWLEFDDLKGRFCQSHENCDVSTSEIHIVFWERNFKLTNEMNLPFRHKDAEIAPTINTLSNIPGQSNQSERKSGAIAFPQVDISDAPSVASPDVPVEEGQSVFGFTDLADDAVITLTLVEIHVDSEGRPLENKQAASLADNVENCTLQAQENTHASQISSPMEMSLSQRPVSFSTNTCGLLAQSDSVSKEDDTLNKQSACLPTVAQVSEITEVQSSMFSHNTVIPHHNPNFSSILEKSTNLKTAVMQTISDMRQSSENIRGNRTLNDDVAELEEYSKKALASNLVKDWLERQPILSGSPKGKTRKSNVDDEQKMPGVLRRHAHERMPLKLTHSIFPVKGADSFDGFMAKSFNKNVEDEITVSPPECNMVSMPPDHDLSEHLAYTEKNVTGQAALAACNTRGINSTSVRGVSSTFEQSMENTEVFNESQQLVSTTWDFSRPFKIHNLRLKLRGLKAKKKELTC